MRLLYQSNGTFHIYSNDPNTSVSNTITVVKDVSANITLAGVNIDVSGTGDMMSEGNAAFKIANDSTGDVRIADMK